MLGVPGEDRLLGHGVSTCATCDGFFFRGQPIAVVGGGDSALEEAIFLSKFASSVLVIHRRKELRASKIMQDRALANPKISFRWDARRRRGPRGRPRLTGVRVRDTVTGAIEELAARRVLRRDRPRAEHRAVRRTSSSIDEAGYLVTHDGTATERRRRLRLRRRPGPRLPPGDHRRRLGLHGGDRRRAVPRGAPEVDSAEHRREWATGARRSPSESAGHAGLPSADGTAGQGRRRDRDG